MSISSVPRSRPTSPMMSFRRRVRPRADASGTKPSVSMTASTRWRVVGMHQVGPAQHPGHGGDRHPGHLGDVVDRGHAGPIDIIRALSYDDSAYIASYLLTLRIDVSAVNSLLGPSRARRFDLRACNVRCRACRRPDATRLKRHWAVTPPGGRAARWIALRGVTGRAGRPGDLLPARRGRGPLSACGPPRPTRPTGPSSPVPGSGRHSSTGTSPGSTRSVPAKKRATCSRVRWRVLLLDHPVRDARQSPAASCAGMRSDARVGDGEVAAGRHGVQQPWPRSRAGRRRPVSRAGSRAA